jgi:hypothetical protein
MNNNYYVYIILDPLENYEFSIGDLKFNSKPFYIGYGKNNRVNEHLHKRELNRNCHKSCKIKSIINTGNIPIIIKIKENLSFEDANNLEIKYISLFGRIDKGTGILTNHTDGGQGTKNKILSEESKKKISKSHMGILHTEESKLKMSLKHKGKILSDTTKKKISIAKTGDGNAFYGKKHNLDSFKTCKTTLQIDIKTNEVISKFRSSMEAERETGIKKIYRVCNGNRKSAGGYKWIYEEDYKSV